MYMCCVRKCGPKGEGKARPHRCSVETRLASGVRLRDDVRQQGCRPNILYPERALR